MSLTKNELIDIAEERLGLPKRQTSENIEMLIEIIKESLENNDDVLISGFGKFSVKEKAERKGRNPAIGESMMIPGRKIVRFKCSGKLRDKINSK
jgi:integration host factor subunit alpha